MLETDVISERIVSEQFHTTHWGLVLAAAEATSTTSEAALQRLCRSYWYPIYVYVRRRGYLAEDAQDLTQDFFAHLLQHDRLNKVHPDKGRFRSFLLASVKNFLADEWDRVKAQKRGGKCSFISLDDGSAEARYLHESVTDHSAEKIFERRWAMEVLDHVLARLREECAAAEKQSLFDRIKAFIPEEPEAGEYAAVADELRMTRSAVAVAIHRLRQRYRELVRDEVARTVATPDEVDAELRELSAALR